MVTKNNVKGHAGLWVDLAFTLKSEDQNMLKDFKISSVNDNYV